MNEESTAPSTVYLVGAGPGDPDLITVKGLDLLERCDVLIHDSLVPPELVARCPAPERHYVGKTAGGHALTQTEITDLLVELATAEGPPRTIVRLKGGDPYVFGRGGEEALACRERGVAVEVVPGVTAGVAAPAYSGVPVTHRSVSRGVIFVTGHQVKGGIPDLPWAELARSGLTLVFYMGVATLPTIAEELLRNGLDPATPAMTIQEGTMPGQRSVAGTLADLPGRVAEARIRPPAITVVGQVAALADQLSEQRPRPLAGKTVVVVRAEERYYPELERLRETGARVLDVSGIRCVARPGEPEVERMLAEANRDQLVLFTSALAVDFFVAAWTQRWPDPELRPTPTFVAASRAFLWAMERHGIPAAFAPEITGAGQVLATLKANQVAAGTVIWLPRSAAADEELPAALAEAGYEPRVAHLYETVAVPVPADVRAVLAEGRADAIVLLSGTCVRSVVESVPSLVSLDEPRPLAATIGPKTAAVAVEAGFVSPLVPSRPTMPDLVQAVIDRLGE